MKMFLLGMMLFITGFIGSLVFLIISILNPWKFNDTGRFAGFLLGTKMLIPFIIVIGMVLIGIYICVFEIYLNDKK